MSDLLHIAGAIWCICDLLSDKNHFLTFLSTKSHQIAQQIAPNRTANCMVRVNGSNSVSYTKSQMQQIASAIYSKSDMKWHACNQPLNGSNSVSDTKSQIHQIASAIYSKSHMKSRTKSHV
jgi:hypothetical protein